jgi:hypothetical protein
MVSEEREFNRLKVLVPLLVVVIAFTLFVIFSPFPLHTTSAGRLEASVRRRLKEICIGQEQFNSGNCVDLNANGIGEFGYLEELGNLSAWRNVSGKREKQSDDSISPYLPPTLRNINNNDYSYHGGYLFCVYLPSGENTAVKKYPTKVDVPLTEKHYIAYAWPRVTGRSGVRAFVIGPEGNIYSYANDGDPPLFEGDKAPTFDAALKASEWGSGIDEGGPGQTGVNINWLKVEE